MALHPFSHKHGYRGQEVRTPLQVVLELQGLHPDCLEMPVCPHCAVVIHQDDRSEKNLEIYSPMWVHRVVRVGPRFDAA